jgi:hypothetical protein
MPLQLHTVLLDLDGPGGIDVSHEPDAVPRQAHLRALDDTSLRPEA